MRRFLLAVLFAALAQLPALADDAANPAGELQKLAWQRGPAQGAIAGKAAIEIPKGFAFLDEANTRRFLEIAGNPPSDGNYMLAPEDLHWFAVFSFDATGYVKDDEKIDPEALLSGLKEGDTASNEERKRLGMHAIFTDGWQVAPHYDALTKRLEWGVRLRDDQNQLNVNYSTRILGRNGVMRAVLVSAPDTLEADTKAFKSALADFNYNPGEAYAEFRQGDKVAEYGLAALVLGGAAAVATKKGLWTLLAGGLAAFWKVLVGIGIAAAAGIKRFFSRKAP
jgi:uncharacterized membrane-anchored protein